MNSNEIQQKHASEIIRQVSVAQQVTGHSSWLPNLGPHDYLKPAWGLVSHKHGRGLYVWCDECLQWNCHGLVDDEVPVGHITSRGPHCHCHGEALMYCMGMADDKLAKILERYYRTARAKFTPPPVRRVYPVVVESERETVAVPEDVMAALVPEHSESFGLYTQLAGLRRRPRRDVYGAA